MAEGATTGGLEARVAELEGKLAECERLLAAGREALDASERKRRIERELAEEGAVDLETAALLTEAAVTGMPEPDIAAAVSELRRRKPFLFRREAARSAMGAEAGPEEPGLEEAAGAARASGDRRALLGYLRMRRGRDAGTR
jgi:hypothetical protein